MKRIYNKVYQAAMAALMLTAATACTDDNAPLQNNDIPPTGRPVTITATYQGVGTPDETDAQTRTKYTLNLPNGGMQVKWEKGDKIYIINSENLKARNTLTEAGFEEFTLVGEGGQATGTFQNDNSSLDLKKKMYAVYCRNNAPNKISVTLPSGLGAELFYSFDMTGQRQPTTNKMSHLADYDLMCATVKANATNPSFNFTHINAILRLSLKLPTNSNGYHVKEVKVTNSQDTFLNPVIVNPESLQTITSNFTNNCTLKCGGEDNNGMSVEYVSGTNRIIAYMMVQSNPISANSNITITVTCTDGNTYSTTITPTTDFVMSPGTYNSIEATLK